VCVCFVAVSTSLTPPWRSTFGTRHRDGTPEAKIHNIRPVPKRRYKVPDPETPPEKHQIKKDDTDRALSML